jgi:two-component system response regulator MtrA
MARIIYVEDDPLVGEVVQEILTQAGHLIGVVPHGTLAFETIVFKKPELILLDQKLPGMQGMEILRALRRLPDLYLTPIIMLTARAGDDPRDDALVAGANDYLVKPFDPAELVRRVGLVLEQTAFTRQPRGGAK